jgi:hypothetical protein
MVKLTMIMVVVVVGRCPGVRWNNTSSLLTPHTNHMSPIRVGIIEMASVDVIDVLVQNVTSSGLQINFYFNIQNVCYT